MAACARAFFKLDKPGSFQRAFQRILEINSWNNLNQVLSFIYFLFTSNLLTKPKQF
jgi:hypothetical protein